MDFSLLRNCRNIAPLVGGRISREIFQGVGFWPWLAYPAVITRHSLRYRMAGLSRTGSCGRWGKMPELQRITDVRVFCPCCKWQGTIGQAEPDIDGDGSLGCPICFHVTERDLNA